MTDHIISAHHLGKTIDHKVILRNITGDIPQGSIVGLIGKNGSGKTTLMELLLGFSIPTTGEARVFGQPILQLPGALKGRIGYVTQQDELISGLTGAQHISLMAALHGHWNYELTDRLAKSWSIALGRRCDALSVGERQKLSTLLALGHEPSLLVLDEPVASLDPIARREFLQELLPYAADGERTVLFSSHILSDLERVADHIWLLREGQLAWQGSLDHLKESVVRITVSAPQPLPSSLPLPTVITQRINGTHAIAVVTHWDEQARSELARVLAAEVQVETLGLDDLFVAFHS
jgi:ABC-2 type transport system ATP-binding protein